MQQTSSFKDVSPLGLRQVKRAAVLGGKILRVFLAGRGRIPFLGYHPQRLLGAGMSSGGSGP